MNDTQSIERSAWLKGPKYPCAPGSDANPGRRWNLILLGGPGVGKGTQAELLGEKLGVCPLSTGEVFRHARDASADMTESLFKAVSTMNEGGLVDDLTVLGIVRERKDCLKCNRGFLLDGFPRTVEQAVSLGGVLNEVDTTLDAVISYELDQTELIIRLSGRRICSSCKKSYHLTHNPPQKEGVCDACGEDLIQRSDDQPDVIKNRLEIFEKETAPIRNFYEARNLLHRIDASGTPEEVLDLTLKALEVDVE